jgi:hypothetical protein
LFGRRREREDLGPEVEIDSDIAEHGPCKRCGRGKHQAAFDDEENRQEQREQTGDTDDDAVVEREGIDLGLIGARLPQAKLRNLRGGQFDHEGHGRAGVHGDEIDRGVGRVLAVGAEALARCEVHDARGTEIGPEQAGARHQIIRSDEQAIDLFVGVVRKREDRPVRRAARGAGADFDAADDAVGARCGRDLEPVAFGHMPLGGGEQIERRRVRPDDDGFERAHGCEARGSRKQREAREYEPSKPQNLDLRARPGTPS